MMQILPRFQLLPPHVVEMVVDFVVDGSKQVFLGTINTNNIEERLLLQMPLLWVCRNFRAVVYLRYSSQYTLELGTQSKKAMAIRSSWPACLRSIHYPTHYLAKGLGIKLEPWIIFTGKALELLSSAPYDGCSFPRVRILWLIFLAERPRMRSTVNSAAIKVNMSAFVARLWQMAPKTVIIKFGGLHSPEYLPKVVRPHFDRLIAQLYQRFRCIVHQNSRLYTFEDLQLDGARDLVTLAYTADSGYDLVMQLAQRNAQTLEHIMVEFSSVVDASRFVQGSEGSYVEYPNLHTLALRHSPNLDRWYRLGLALPRQEDWERAQLPVFPGATPFPKLRWLMINIDYPFGDDTPFRGNASTLKSLYMVLYHTTVDVLDRYQVFRPFSHSKLRIVYTSLICDLRTQIFATSEAYCRFALSIGPQATTREIGSESFRSLLLDAPTLFNDYTCIRALSLPNTEPVLWDVVMLVKSLPNLSDLHTMAPNITPVSGLSLIALRDYQFPDGISTGERLWCWTFGFSRSYQLGNLSTYLLMLTNLCRGLNINSLQDGSRELLTEDESNSVDLRGFERSSGRMWHIIKD